MTNFNNVGFEVKYPPGCKEIVEGLRPDEVKRRLMDLINAFEEIKSDSHDLTINDTVTESVDNFLIEEGKRSVEDYRGLAYYLASESFLDNEDKDIQIRVGVCLSVLISIFCPKNVYESFSDSKDVIKRVLEFLIKCLDELSRAKSKGDKHFINLFKILTITCHIDLFHWYLLLDDGDDILMSCFKTMFNIVRKLGEWPDQEETIKTITDALTALLSSSDSYKLPDNLVQYLLNYLVDPAVTKRQKELSSEILTRCGNKLEDQIQNLLQGYLLKDSSAIDQSELSSSDEGDGNDDGENGAGNDDQDDVCSLDSYLRRKKLKRDAKIATKKANTYLTCSHTFQLIYEIFKVNETIIGPVLPILDVKLKSTSSSDRKRACRLLGKLFGTSSVTVSTNQSGLWEGLLGRFLDIDVGVREVCIKVARDLLRLSSTKNGNDSSAEELASALEKRSHDQEDNIRLQVVLAAVDILEKSGSVMHDENLSGVNDILLTIIIDRSRDRSLDVRKAAYSYIGKLYRGIMDSISKNNFDLGLDLLTGPLRERAEMLLNKTLRLYQRQDVQDRIIVERLFNTCLIPYGAPAQERMRALFHCFILSNDTWIKSIHELMKTQRMILNELSLVVVQLSDMTNQSGSAVSTEMSTKLRENIKILSESLPGKDRLDNLTKLFTIVKSDSKLLEQFKIFINPNSTRSVILKSISEIKRLINNSTELGHQNSKKKSLVTTAKCLLERCAPIIIDKSISQEIIPFLVSIMDKCDPGDDGVHIPLTRVLSVLQVLIVIYKHTLPINDVYEYLVTVLKRFERKKSVEIRAVLSDEANSTPGSIVSNKGTFSAGAIKMQFTPSVEELALTIFTKLVREPSNTTTETSHQFDETLVNTITLTDSVLGYLEQCCSEGGLKTNLVNATQQFKSSTETEVQSEELNLLQDDNQDPHHLPDSIKSQFCRWKYDCKIAKFAIRSLLGLHCSLKQVITHKSFEIEDQDSVNALLENIEAIIDRLVTSTINEKKYDQKPFLLKVILQIVLYSPAIYGENIKKFVSETILEQILSNSDSNTQQNTTTTDSSVDNTTNTETTPLNKGLVEDSQIELSEQIKILSIKLIAHYVSCLHPEQDKPLISQSLTTLQTLLQSSNSHLRLAAGTAWLKLAQTQSLLPLLDVTGLYRTRALIHDESIPVRSTFLRKLHQGLFRLRLPLDYMALFSIVPRVDTEIIRDTRQYLSANIIRRREFLDRHPEYCRDSRLFAVLPEYVLAFVIHMLAHDSDWADVENTNDESSPEDENKLQLIKQSLWFIMEPLIKHGENYSFIRKLLEKIKHAKDATDPENEKLNAKLHVAADIALGLLISRQTNPVLRDYPVELRLPRTRYITAPPEYNNPDFTDLIVTTESMSRARIQFTPPPRAKATLKNQMPPILIKGGAATISNTAAEHNSNQNGTTNDANNGLPIKRHYKAQIKIVVPEQEQEIIEPKKKTNKRTAIKRKPDENTIQNIKETEDDEDDLLHQTPISVSKKGRICKSNKLLFKDMVSPNKIPNTGGLGANDITPVISPSKKRAARQAAKQRKSKSQAIKGLEKAAVVLEGQVSVPIKRLEEERETETEEEEEIRPQLKTKRKMKSRKSTTKITPKSNIKKSSKTQTSIKKTNIEVKSESSSPRKSKKSTLVNKEIVEEISESPKTFTRAPPRKRDINAPIVNKRKRKSTEAEDSKEKASETQSDTKPKRKSARMSIEDKENVSKNSTNSKETKTLQEITEKDKTKKSESKKIDSPKLTRSTRSNIKEVNLSDTPIRKKNVRIAKTVIVNNTEKKKISEITPKRNIISKGILSPTKSNSKSQSSSSESKTPRSTRSESKTSRSELKTSKSPLSESKTPRSTRLESKTSRSESKTPKSSLSESKTPRSSVISKPLSSSTPKSSSNSTTNKSLSTPKSKRTTPTKSSTSTTQSRKSKINSIISSKSSLASSPINITVRSKRSASQMATTNLLYGNTK